jgi:hypothetical protein
MHERKPVDEHVSPKYGVHKDMKNQLSKDGSDKHSSSNTAT